jgi:hypothetical protein
MRHKTYFRIFKQLIVWFGRARFCRNPTGRGDRQAREHSDWCDSQVLSNLSDWLVERRARAHIRKYKLINDGWGLEDVGG